QNASSLQEPRSQQADFGRTAAWHDGQDPCGLVHTQETAGRSLVWLHGNDTRQRMPNVSHRHALLAVDFLFERKQYQHMRHGGTYLVDTFVTPGPDGWSDKMDCGNASLLELI